MTHKFGLCLAALLSAARLCLCQYGYNYDANYYDDYSLYNAGGFPRSPSKQTNCGLCMHLRKLDTMH